MLSIGGELLYKIVEEKSYKILAQIKREYFVDEELKLYDYLHNFISKYHDLPNIETFIKDNRLEPVELPETIIYYLDKVIDRFKRNVILQNIETLNRSLQTNDIDKTINILDDIINTTKEAEISTSDLFYTYKEMLELSLEKSIENRTKKLTGIPTGWETLDNAINGFNKGNLYVVLARVKIGKSAVLIRMSRVAYKAGYKVMFFSLEMPAIEIADRLLGIEFGLNKTLLTKGRLSSFTEKQIREELNSAYNNDDRFKFVDGKFSTSIEEIEFIIKQYQPDIVFIDGAYLIRTKKNFRTKWELVSYTAEQLKLIATNMQIPIVASYQFNRNISRKSDSVSDKGFENIGLSDAISQLTSVGIALLKPEESDSVRTIEIFGSRDGITDKFTINWDWNNMNFDEIKDYE